MRRACLLVAAAGVGLAVVLIAGGCPSGPGTGGGGGVSNLEPQVALIATPDPPIGVKPFTVDFNSGDSTDDGVIVRRVWDFGDGTPDSEEIAPAHIYQTDGVFTVRLTLTDDDGISASETVEVTVTERPIAILQVDRDRAETAPATFAFDGTASYDPDGQEGETLLYAWNFGDGGSSSDASVAHTFASPGDYQVVLTVTDATGITGTAERIIQVGIARPDIQFRAPPATVKNIVLPQGLTAITRSPLWVQTVFEVAPGVPFTTRAGLDPDIDPLNGNDIPLDLNGNDGVLVPDLNLIVPQPLDVSQVAAGAYNLWVQLTTDRTLPTRTYFGGLVHIIAPPTTTISGDTPRLPPLAAGAEDWSVIMPLTDQRQIVDLGPLNLGDRLTLSLLELPGYTDVYTAADFSVLVVDASQKMFVWYDNVLNLFTPNSRLIIGHSSPSYYLVVDVGTGGLVPNVHVGVQRGAAPDSEPRRQLIYLDFNGTGGQFISIANSTQFRVPPMDLEAYTPAEQQTLELAVLARVQQLFDGYDIVVSASTGGAAPPADPHKAVYFDTSGDLVAATPDTNGDGLVNLLDLPFYGLSNYLDPRNQTASGLAGIAVDQLVSATGLAQPADMATLTIALSNAVAHHVGLMSGLRPTQGNPADVMTNNQLVIKNALIFTVSNLAPLARPGYTAFGTQDAPMLLGELFTE